MALDPKDPLGPPDPTDPFYIPPDYPVFTEATPTPDPPASGCCPYCGTRWLSGKGGHASEGEAGVCADCLGLCIATETGWRMATYDEAEAWDQDPRVKAMRAIWGKPLPDI